MAEIEAWLARDKDNDLCLFIGGKPEKEEKEWMNLAFWVRIDSRLFPEVQWSDEEPTKVKLVIKNKMARNTVCISKDIHVNVQEVFDELTDGDKAIFIGNNLSALSNEDIIYYLEQKGYKVTKEEEENDI